MSLTAVAENLGVGHVGWFTAGIKDIADTQIGDTVTGVERPTDDPIPGFKPAMPVVFSGLYPTDTEDYPKLREALEPFIRALETLTDAEGADEAAPETPETEETP